MVDHVPPQTASVFVDAGLGPPPTAYPDLVSCTLGLGGGIPIAHVPVVSLTDNVITTSTIDANLVSQDKSVTTTTAPVAQPVTTSTTTPVTSHLSESPTAPSVSTPSSPVVGIPPTSTSEQTLSPSSRTTPSTTNQVPGKNTSSTKFSSLFPWNCIDPTPRETLSYHAQALKTCNLGLA